MHPVLLWFRRNLRLADNAALIAAVDSGRPVIPVYVRTPQDAGGASQWWLHHSLASLDRELKELGSGLVIRSGPADTALRDLVNETDAGAVCFARRYEPDSRAEEEAIDAGLHDGIDIRPVDDSLLCHPNSVKTRSDRPYKIFTPFWKASARLGEPAAAQPVPDKIEWQRPLPTSLSLEDLGLLPTAPDWAQGLRDTWQPGRMGALRRLEELEDVLGKYAEYRDRPDVDGTSRLSAHLHFGEISVREAWHAVRSVEAREPVSKSAEMLLRQLYWREFSTYLLFHFPMLPQRPLRREFEHFPWSDDGRSLRAWQQGMTGYPIVDAGMRQLWATGWMHNRVRMIAASFLAKDLRVPWQRGADWFLDTLVDADLANNSASWQWVSGCGTDAAPYFRIFNPVLQGRRFDPRGTYVRQWVPEIAALPDHVIHDPWNAPAGALAAAGIELGEQYPGPIVDHAAARDEALAAYRAIRGNRTSKVAPGDS